MYEVKRKAVSLRLDRRPAPRKGNLIPPKAQSLTTKCLRDALIPIYSLSSPYLPKADVTLAIATHGPATVHIAKNHLVN